MKGTLKLRKPAANNPQELYFHSYDLIHSEYSFHKKTDKKGKVQADVLSGNIRVTLPVLPDDALMTWVFDNRKFFNGEISIHDDYEESLDKIYFEQGRCINFHLHYEPDSDNAEKSIKTMLVINAQRIITGEEEYISN